METNIKSIQDFIYIEKGIENFDRIFVNSYNYYDYELTKLTKKDIENMLAEENEYLKCHGVKDSVNLNIKFYKKTKKKTKIYKNEKVEITYIHRGKEYMLKGIITDITEQGLSIVNCSYTPTESDADYDLYQTSLNFKIIIRIEKLESLDYIELDL